MDREAGPTLRPVPGIDLAIYKATLIERFANPNINTVERVNADAPLCCVRERLKTALTRGRYSASIVCSANWRRASTSWSPLGNGSRRSIPLAPREHWRELRRNLDSEEGEPE